MFGGKEIVMTQLRKRAVRESTTPRAILSALYERNDQRGIGKILGVDHTSIGEAMVRLGVPRRAKRTPAPKGIVAQILTRRGRTTGRSALQMFRSMYFTKGMGIVDIANELGVSTQTVRAFATSRGIQLRRVGRPSGKTRTAKRTQRTFDFSTGCL